MLTRKVKFKRKHIASSKHIFEGEILPFKRTLERGKIYELPDHAAMYHIRRGNADYVQEGEVSQIKEEYLKEGQWHSIKK